MASFLFTRKRREAPISPRPLGLKTLANGGLDCPCLSNCVHRNFAASRSVSPNHNKDGGTRHEIKTEAAAEEEDNACWASYGRGHGRKFPPAMPLLARTGNLSCHMPWVLERTYESGGRLVIREVRVKHHEYFRARRENGRLTLQLFELDENSPLFESTPKCQQAEDEESNDEDSHLSPSLSSLSSSPTSPLSHMTKGDGGEDTTNRILDLEAMRRKDNGTDGTIRLADPEATRGKENGGTDKSSGFAMSPCPTMVSSSMPEPAAPMGMKGCFTGDRGSGPLDTMMPVSRMRAVHV